MFGCRSLKCLVAASALVLFGGIAEAAVNVTWATGTTYTTKELTGYATYGDMMDGMKVVATFGDGSMQTAYWADSGVDSGSAVGTGWSLTESGDTFSGYWSLNAANLTNLFIDAGVGNTVFDTTFIGDIFGTAGSARGLNFGVVSGLGTDMNLDVLYSGAVAVGSNSAVGDLFRYIDLDFGSAYSGTLVFKADTDNLLYAGDIRPVPEPGTTMLLGSGLLALVGYRRVRRA